jgi:hypothetical protein
MSINSQQIEEISESLLTNKECEINIKDLELCEHLVNFLLMVNSKKSVASEQNLDKQRILNSELYCICCKGFFDQLNKNEHNYHEIINQGMETNNSYCVSEIFEKIEKKFFSVKITEEEYMLKNLETDFNSEIEKSITNVHSLFLKLKEQKLMEFSKFKKDYDTNFEKIKKDFFDLKFKFSKFYMKNEAYFFPKNTMSNLNKSKFDHTIMDVIYLINMDLSCKLQQAEQKLEAHIESEKTKAFGHKNELHKILVKFNSQIQNLLNSQIKFNTKEKVFPEFTQDLDISLKKFNHVFEDLNKAYVNIKNPIFSNKFEDYLTEAENDFFLKYFAKLAESSVCFKGAAYEKKRIISVQNKNVFNYLENNPVNGNNRFYEVAAEPHLGKSINKDAQGNNSNNDNNRNRKKSIENNLLNKKMDWETNDANCVYKEIEEYKVNKNISKQRFSVKVNEDKSRQYFENFFKKNNNNDDEAENNVKGFRKSLTLMQQEKGYSPEINRVIGNVDGDLNADKNFLKRNTVNVFGLNNLNNINNDNYKIVNNNLIANNDNKNDRKNDNNSKTFEQKSKSIMGNKRENKQILNNNVNVHISNKSSNASVNIITFNDENSNLKKKTSYNLPEFKNAQINKFNNSSQKKNSLIIKENSSKNQNTPRKQPKNSFDKFIDNENHKQNNNHRDISRSKSFVAINKSTNNNSNKELSKSLSRKNSEFNFANNNLNRSNSVFNKNDIALKPNNSSRKLLRKNSSSFLKSTIDDSAVNSNLKLTNFKRKSSLKNNNNSNAEFSDYENEIGKGKNINQVKNKRSASQININKSKNYFFENQASIKNNVDYNTNNNSEENDDLIVYNNNNNNNIYNNNNNNNGNIKNKNNQFENFDDDKIRYIMNVNKKNKNALSSTKKTVKNYNQKCANINNNVVNDNNKFNGNFANKLNTAKIKFLENNIFKNKTENKNNFKTVKVISPQVILNVFRELEESKELQELKPYKEKDYHEKLKHSIESKLYMLKKFFILLLLEKFSDLDDKNFSNYCSNSSKNSPKTNQKANSLLGSNLSNYSEYNILLNENHLENLTNVITPKAKVLTNEMLIFNRRNMTIYKHFVPLNNEEHGIGYFLDGCRYIVANEKIYISGGRDEEHYFSVFLEYDYMRNSIRRLNDLCYARAYHKMIFCHNKQRIYFLGGENNNSCEFYDCFKNVNLPMPSLNEPRSYLNAYVSCDGKKIYALFGIKGKILQSEFCDKVEVLDLVEYEEKMQHLLSASNKDENILFNMELKKYSCGYDNSVKISNIQSVLGKIRCDEILNCKWNFVEYKNSADIDLKFRYVGVYPLEKDILLLIGGCLYREINLMISVFDVRKNEISNVNADIVSEIMRRAKDDVVLMKILAEINKNIYK